MNKREFITLLAGGRPRGRSRRARCKRPRGCRAAEKTNTETKALAMRWVIHLMGDLHQPMHVMDRGDRGGKPRSGNGLRKTQPRRCRSARRAPNIRRVAHDVGSRARTSTIRP
jgi:S1/P1 Nuclease